LARIVPLSLTLQPWSASVKATSQSQADTPQVCVDQLSPPSLVARIHAAVVVPQVAPESEGEALDGRLPRPHGRIVSQP
jgi:hypothetical protein